MVRFNILFVPTQCAAQALDYVQAIVDKAVTEGHCRDDCITHFFLLDMPHTGMADKISSLSLSLSLSPSLSAEWIEICKERGWGGY